MARPKTSLDPFLDAELFATLSDPSRLGILCRLATAGRPLGVSAAAEQCGVHVSGASRHLSALQRAGLVRAIRQGREVLYVLDPSPVIAALRGLADALEACARGTCCQAGGPPLRQKKRKTKP